MKELDLIRLIERIFGSSFGADTALGMGDDCAAIQPAPGCEMLVTTDALVDRTHFRRDWTTPQCLGEKSVCVSVSDIAAMGGRPRHLLLSLTAPGSVDRRWITAYLKGFEKAAARCACGLIGGNVSLSDSLSFTITAIGEVKKGRRVERSGARPGDAIYITGTPGDAALGLDLLQAQKKNYSRAERKLIARHNRPTPRVQWGRLVADRRIASAMIDVSDGVALDLRRILESSGGGAVLKLAELPLSREAARAVTERGRDGWRRVISGGEDYELLFTVPPGKTRSVKRLIGAGSITAVRIGHIVSGKPRLTILDPAGRTLKLDKEGYLHNQK